MESDGGSIGWCSVDICPPNSHPSDDGQGSAAGFLSLSNLSNATNQTNTSCAAYPFCVQTLIYTIPNSK